MASEGPNSPASVTGDGGSGATWSNPTNATASDDSRATASINGFVAPSTRVLEATDFGFSIPSGATIDGVVVEVERSCTTTAGNPRDAEVYLVVPGEITGTGDNKAKADVWPTTDAYVTYGGASDLWGAALTPADVNDSGFGCWLKAAMDNGKDSTTVRVDHVRITVYYTEAAGGGNRRRRVILCGR